jgi:lipid-A-disaccharide synthase
MLTLFPFEAKYYRKHHVPVTFVGHPLADQIADKCDVRGMRRKLKIPVEGTTVALLPGSRMSELTRHAELFVKTAIWLHERNKDIQFIAPFVDKETKAVFDDALYRLGAWFLPIKTVIGNSREAMAASDVILLASGTATLEAALLKKPMVVTYKVSWPSFLLIKLFAHVKLFALPNILAGRKLVPEFMQRDAIPEKLGSAVEDFLLHPQKTKSVQTALAGIRSSLRCSADIKAAEAVQKLLKSEAKRLAQT